jgi:predicted lipoprotein with Yx(FWY)xxD motif
VNVSIPPAAAASWRCVVCRTSGRPAAGHPVGASAGRRAGGTNGRSEGECGTYDGWPLYGYAGDVQPGQATGQDVFLNGGEWYVIGPSGRPLTSPP